MSQELKYAITAETDNFAAGARKVAVEMNSIGSVATTVNSKIKGAFSQLGTQMAGFFALGTLTNEFKQLVDEASKMRDGSQALGITIKQYQELAFVADQSGGSMEDFVQALKAISHAQANALRGNDEFANSFERFGISMAQLRQMNPDQLMGAIAAKLNGGAVNSQILADSLKVMGGTAERVLPAMVGGFADLIDQAQKLGVILGDDVVNKLGNIQDKLSVIRMQSREPLAEVGLFLAQWAQGIGDVFAIPGRQIGSTLGKASTSFKDIIDVRHPIDSTKNWAKANVDLVADPFREFKAIIDERAKIEAMVAAQSKKTGPNQSAASAVFETEKIKKLTEDIAKLERENSFESLSTAQRLSRLTEERLQIMEKIATAPDEVTRLSLQLERAKLDKDINGARKDDLKSVNDEQVNLRAANDNVDALTRVGGVNVRDGRINTQIQETQRQTQAILQIQSQVNQIVSQFGQII